MDANTSIDKLINSINSFQDHIDNLQNSADSLNEIHQSFSDNVGDENIHPDIKNKISDIQNHVISRSKHLEDLVSNVLNPDIIQKKIQNIQKLQDRKNYWINRNKGK